MNANVLAWVSLALVALSWVALLTLRVHGRKCGGDCSQGRAPCVCAMQEWE